MSTNRWWRPALVLKAMHGMRKPLSFLHFLGPSLSLHPWHLFPSYRGRASLFWPLVPWALSSPVKDRACVPCTGRQIHRCLTMGPPGKSLFSPLPSSPLPIPSFRTKTGTHLPCSETLPDTVLSPQDYCQRSFPASHAEQRPYSCPNTACRKITQSASAFEGTLWVSEGQRICVSNEPSGDAHVEDSPVSAFTLDCSFIPHYFFHLPQVVPKNHHWSSYPHIQWLFPLSLASLLRPHYHFSQVVTCHPFLEISSLGFTDMMILLWLLFHEQLQFPLIVALPPPVTWKNLVTPQVITLQFSICSLVYLCLCSFPQELSDFMTAKCIFQMHVSKGTFAPNHIPTSNSTSTSCSNLKLRF